MGKALDGLHNGLQGRKRMKHLFYPQIPDKSRVFRWNNTSNYHNGIGNSFLFHEFKEPGHENLWRALHDMVADDVHVFLDRRFHVVPWFLPAPNNAYVPSFIGDSGPHPLAPLMKGIVPT